jgi:hypothetical protein
MSRAENAGKIIASVLNEVVNDNLVNTNEAINKTVTKMIKASEEAMGIDKNQPDRNKEVESATRSILSKFEKTFSKLSKENSKDKLFNIVKDFNLNYFEGSAIFSIIASSSLQEEEKISALKEAIFFLEERIDMLNKS